LTYTWTVTSAPSGAATPTFSANGTNAAQNSTATFYQAGSYTFQATIKNLSGLTATSSVGVTVSQTFSSVALSPASVTLALNATQQFTATASDQFAKPMATQPAFTWTLTGIGTLSSAGLYTAPASTGSASVKATSGSFSSTAAVTVSGSVSPTLTSLALLPGSLTLAAGTSQPFTPWPKDQSGNLVTPAPTYTWRLSGIGTLSSSGVYTAPTGTGTATITVTTGNLSASTTVTVTAPPAPGISFNAGTGVLSIYADTVHAGAYKDVAKTQIVSVNGVPTLNAFFQSLTQTGSPVWMDSQYFTLSQVVAIYYYGQASLNNYYTNLTAVPCTAYGGNYFNQLEGGSGTDYLYAGGAGSQNTLKGWDGDDVLVGGAGTNYLYGGTGNNVLIPGSGVSYLYPNG
jgi:Ca2+-binding RTX toxin-like protein